MKGMTENVTKDMFEPIVELEMMRLHYSMILKFIQHKKLEEEYESFKWDTLIKYMDNDNE